MLVPRGVNFQVGKGECPQHKERRKRGPEEGVNLCKAFLPRIEENILLECMSCFCQDLRLDFKTGLHNYLRVKSIQSVCSDPEY